VEVRIKRTELTSGGCKLIRITFQTSKITFRVISHAVSPDARGLKIMGCIISLLIVLLISISTMGKLEHTNNLKRDVEGLKSVTAKNRLAVRKFVGIFKNRKEIFFKPKDGCFRRPPHIAGSTKFHMPEVGKFNSNRSIRDSTTEFGRLDVLVGEIRCVLTCID